MDKTKFQWRIGSGSDCDIVQRNSAVSRQHCVLRLTSTGFVIEDLESTNGVFVNGVQIQGQASIKTSDQVTLGKRVPLPWPALNLPERTLTIGRANDNDIVLDFDNISSHHARLVLKGDELTIEDLGSTNGVYVGEPPTRVKSAKVKVKVEDAIGFGSHRMLVAQLLATAFAIDSSSNVPLEPTLREKGPTSTASTNSQFNSKTLGTIAAAAACVLVVLVVGWLATRNRSSPSSSQFAANDDPDSSPLASGQVVPIQTTETVAQSSSSTPAGASAAVDSQPAVGPFFWVIVANTASNEAYRLGTAWAAKPDRLVTAASIIQALENPVFRERFPDAAVVPMETNVRRPLETFHAHPRYAPLRREAEEKIAKYEQAMEHANQKNNPSTSADRAPEDVDQLFTDCAIALQKTVAFDVAVLEFREPIATTLLQPASAAAPLRPKLRLVATGPAFDLEDPYFDPQEPRSPVKLEARVVTPPNDKSDKAQHLVCETTPGHHALNYLGCPIQNAAGDVLAMYCRPTPPDNANSASRGQSFDAVPWSAIQELLAGETKP